MDDDFRGKGYVRRFGPQALSHLQTLPELKNKKQFLIEGLPKNTPANKTAQRLGFINIGTTLIQGLVKVFPQVMSIPEHPTLKTNNFN